MSPKDTHSESKLIFLGHNRVHCILVGTTVRQLIKGMRNKRREREPREELGHRGHQSKPQICTFQRLQ